MARKPKVTRTIKTLKLNVLCLDTESAEPFNEVVILPLVKDDKKALKAVQDLFEGTTKKAVHIVDKEEVETLYGMDEQEFIKNSVILDKETRKEIVE